MALGCFFLEAAGEVPLAAAFVFPFEAGFAGAAAGSFGELWVFGFIWMILRVRVGGGGRSRSSRGLLKPACDGGFALRLGSSRGDVGDAGKKTEGSDRDDLLLAPFAFEGLKAAGGRAKTSEPSIIAWSLSLMISSPDMAGVGGRRERDIVWKRDYEKHDNIS